jgi:glycosyltransferase involved in cell wall biosynthesis
MFASGVSFETCDPVRLPSIFFPSPQAEKIAAVMAGADVVHLHGIWNPMLQLAARIALQMGKPYLLSTHGVLDRRAMRYGFVKRVKKWAAIEFFGVRKMIDRSAGVIFGSKAEAQESVQVTSNLKAVYIPNGSTTDTGLRHASDEEFDRLKRIAPHFPEWRRSLLFFARIHREKGPSILVEAFKRLSLEFPEAGLLVAGLSQDKILEAEVQALVSTAPIPNRVVFTTDLTGPGSQFLNGICDIFVLPSRAEGFSMALTQALAYGKPMLITRYCHMPEVEQWNAGVIVDPDVASITAGLRNLLSKSDSELAQMGRNARALFEALYTWDHVAKQLESTYSAARHP